ncbi:MAG: hypothetical protein QMC04_11105 [Ilumatobacter sp.]|jgi:DNA polymerase-4
MSALRLSVDFGKSPSHCPHTPHSVDGPDSAHCGIAELDVILRGISDRITRRMRSADRVGRTITLRLRFDDFASATRSHSLLTAARPMIDERGLTLLGASVGNLENESTVQMALPFEWVQACELDAAIDAIRNKFGGAALTRADRIGSDVGFGVPLLPDESKASSKNEPT